MKLKHVRYLLAAVISVIALLFFVGALTEHFTLFVLIGLGLLIVWSAMVLVLWRCPHCDKALGRDFGKFCPHCGKRIRD